MLRVVFIKHEIKGFFAIVSNVVGDNAPLSVNVSATKVQLGFLEQPLRSYNFLKRILC